MSDRSSDGSGRGSDDAGGRSWQEYLRQSEGGDAGPALGRDAPEDASTGRASSSEPSSSAPTSTAERPRRESDQSAGSDRAGTPPPEETDPQPAPAAADEETEDVGSRADEPRPDVAAEVAEERETRIPVVEPMRSRVRRPETSDRSSEVEDEAPGERSDREPVGSPSGTHRTHRPRTARAGVSPETPADQDRPRRRRILSGAVSLAAVLVALVLVPGWQGSTEGAQSDVPGPDAPTSDAPSAFFAAAGAADAPDASDARDASDAAPDVEPSRDARLVRQASAGPAGGRATRSPERLTPGRAGESSEGAVPAPPERIAGPAVPEIEDPGVGPEAAVSLASEQGFDRGLPPPPSGAAPSEGPRWIPRDTDPVLANADEVRGLLLERYPERLRDDGVGGSVTLWLFVDEAGRVTRVRVQAPSPQEALNRAAEEVARAMEFRPARSGDRAIGVWVQQSLTFRTGG